MLAEQWTLDEALGLIRALQPECRPFGYHLCLGGSVLNRGTSAKDLDLYFLPMAGGGHSVREAELMAWLTSIWGPGEPIGQQYNGAGAEQVYTLKLQFNYSGLRIDAFVLGVPLALVARQADDTRRTANGLPLRSIQGVWGQSIPATLPTPTRLTLAEMNDLRRAVDLAPLDEVGAAAVNESIQQANDRAAQRRDEEFWATPAQVGPPVGPTSGRLAANARAMANVNQQIQEWRNRTMNPTPVGEALEDAAVSPSAE